MYLNEYEHFDLLLTVANDNHRRCDLMYEDLFWGQYDDNER